MSHQDQIRVTGGEFRGRKLLTPGGHTHPMGARERLALFNMLGEHIRDAAVIDAYAGAGTLGIEALSRGAARVVFIESATPAMQIIRKNCDLLHIPSDKVAFCWETVRDFCAKIAKQGAPTSQDDDQPERNVTHFDLQLADIVLADPPYDAFDEIEVSCLANVLRSGGIMILSHPGAAPSIAGLELLRTRQYARAHLSFYQKY